MLPRSLCISVSGGILLHWWNGGGVQVGVKLVVVRNQFLAALSSSRRLVVCPSVGPLVRWSVAPSVGPSEDLCEKVTFRVLNE